MTIFLILSLLQAPDVLRVGNGVTPPTILTKVNPEYSESARASKVQGTVVLEAVISEEGIPKVARLVRSLGYGLDESAIAAVERWRFRPGTKDGIPVKVSLNIEVNFNLDSGRIVGLNSQPSRQSVTVTVVDPQSPDIIYAGTKTGVYKTDDGGDSWRLSGAFDNVGALVIDPQNSGVLYAGSSSQGMFKSSDAGTTWVPLGRPATRAIEIDPRTSTTVYAVTVTGISKSTDGGITWTDLMPGGAFSKLSVNPGATNSILAVTEFGELFGSTDGGSHWKFIGDNLKDLRARPATPVTGSRTVVLSATDLVDNALSAPKLVSPPEGAVFNAYPRQMTVRWSPTPNAVSYIVEWDYSYNGVWHLEEQKMPDFGYPVQGLEFSFEFVGAQPGRWRVWPVNAAGQHGTPSEWRTFTYTR